MGAHIDKDGQFQSDKYPTCPPGKVPLSVKDKMAQPLLWAYAQLHRAIDPEFSDDLEAALRAAGYAPPDGHAANKPGQSYDDDDRRRAAALAACEGLPTEALERGIVQELYQLAAGMTLSDRMAVRDYGAVLIPQKVWDEAVRPAIDRLNETVAPSARH